MPGIKARALLVTTCLLLACSPASPGGQGEDPTPPAQPIPTHELTVDRADTPLEAEVGDWIEAHLPEPEPPLRWRQESESPVELVGPAAGEPRDSEQGSLRVFRYRARSIGQATLRFTLEEPEEEAPARRMVTFTVEIR